MACVRWHSGCRVGERDKEVFDKCILFNLSLFSYVNRLNIRLLILKNCLVKIGIF